MGGIHGDTLEYPLGNSLGFDKRTSAALKLFAVLAAIWLLNVGFVAIHEGGHSAIAAAFGAKIYSIYVSVTGLEGSTTHDVLTVQSQTDLVLAAGMIATTVALVIAFLARFELAVYVLGLRTVESLLNYSTGSDMLALLRNVGTDAYLFSAVMIGIAALCVGLTIRRRISLIRSTMPDCQCRACPGSIIPFLF